MKNKQEYWNKSRVGSGEGSHEEFLKKELFFNSKKAGQETHHHLIYCSQRCFSIPDSTLEV